MNGFGGAGAFSDGKYNITNEFGGNLYEYVGRAKAIELMEYVDDINVSHGGESTRLFSNDNAEIRKKCLENDLHLLNAKVRHLGTDINYVVLENLYNELKEKADFFFNTHIDSVEQCEGGYRLTSVKGETFEGTNCIISTGRSGSKWMQKICDALDIKTESNRVDIGVRVELPAAVFAHLTDELYESKIVYRTQKFQDKVRTFCMNPRGVVVNENTNGIVTVNGHSYEDPSRYTENTNFALLVQPLYRTVQGQQRIRRKHRPSVQHAGRRRDRTALRGSDPRTAKHEGTHCGKLRDTDAECDAGRSEP